jgi:hypothetical protein
MSVPFAELPVRYYTGTPRSFAAFGRGHDSQQGDNLQQRIGLVPFYSGVFAMLKKVD